MKKLIKISLIIFSILTYSCSSFNKKNSNVGNESNNDLAFYADSIFQTNWQPRNIGENIIGIYSTDTPPLYCVLKITKDSIVYLNRKSKRYNILLSDTFKISLVSRQKPMAFRLQNTLKGSGTKFFDSCYSNNGFIIFHNDTNYLLFYKSIDENGNTIKFPESDYITSYFTDLYSLDIEKRIIEYYFDSQIAELPKLRYELPDSIFKRKSTRKRW